MVEYSFKGYDFTELFPYLGLEVADGDHDVEQLEFAFGELLGVAWVNGPEPDDFADKVAAIRAFVDALAVDADKHCYWAPVWRGLAAVEDDETFLQACRALARHMWT